MASRDEIVSQMIATLAITDPELDTSIGSVTRKILDAVATPVADAYIDQHLLAYQYDIDSKIDADLDSFCQLFGIARFAPKRSTGVVTFYRDAAAASRAISIPYATQVSSKTQPVQVAQTVTAAFMGIGVTSIQVPVQAVDAGPAGNIGAGLLSAILTPADAALRVTNVQSLTGGTPREGDSELRERWRRTVFRSLAGTEPMYLGVALDDPDCFAANVVGATKTHVERVQVKNGRALSQIDDLRYIYPGTISVGINIGAGQLLVEGRDYTFNTAARPPELTILVPNLDTGEENPLTGERYFVRAEGSILDVRYEYAPMMTRNRPQAGITNRIDVWCAGTRPVKAKQTLLFKDHIRFQPFPSSPYYFANFERLDGRQAVEGNHFIPLAQGPILTVPNTLNVGNETFELGEDYWIVHDRTEEGFTSTSRFGLEWKRASLPSPFKASPRDDAVLNRLYFTVGNNDDYTFNAVPRDIQGNIDRWRLTGTDAKAHQAQHQHLRFSLAVMFSQRYDQRATITQMEQAIDKHLRSLGFNATLQASDILTAVGAVSGVDNVRFLIGSDYPGYTPEERNNFNIGIQRVVNGQVRESYVERVSGQVRDKTFGDSEIPVFDSIANEFGIGGPSIRAQNTFYKRGPAIIPGDWIDPDDPASFPDPDAPEAPSGVTQGPAVTGAVVLSGNLTGQNLLLSWSADAAALGYTLFKGGTRVASFGPANGTPSASSHTVTEKGVYTVRPYTAHTGNVDTATYGITSNNVTWT